MSDPPPPGAPPPPRPAGGIRTALSRIVTAEDRFLLWPPPAGVPGRLVRAGQSAVLAARHYREDHAADRAAALAFATLLSMLPLLLLALAALGAAGLGASDLEIVRRWLLRNFVPETARGIQETLEAALASLQRASRGLGIAGGVALVLVGGKLLATLQRTFGQIWGARDFRARLRRMVAFWGAVVLCPFLVLASIVLSGAVETLRAEGVLPGGWLSTAATLLLPAVPGWAAVLLVFRFCTGVRTPWRAAALGATLAACAWEVLKAGFALYLREAFVARTVLSGMGVVPVFLLWLYLSWVVFLWGAEFAFVAHDYEGALRKSGLRPPDGPTSPGAPGGPPPSR